MKAWQLIDTGVPLHLADVDEPSAGPDEVVIDLHASGLCHSDVSALDDPDWREIFPFTPVTLGHEPAGIISEIGDGVTDWAIGDRVGVVSGPPSMVGYTRPGAYAPKCTALAESLVRIPDSVGFVEAAAGTDSGVVSHHAVAAVGNVGPGDKVGIIGIGGLGQIGARVAVLRGAEVYAAEINEAVWPIAQEVGVRRVVSDISELSEAGLDVIVDFAGFGTTTANALEAIRPGGRVVQVGMGRLSATISTSLLIRKKIELVGSMGGTVEDLQSVFQYMASGDLQPVLSTIGFADIDQGLERLRKGEVRGRLVATF